MNNTKNVYHFISTSFFIVLLVVNSAYNKGSNSIVLQKKFFIINIKFIKINHIYSNKL